MAEVKPGLFNFGVGARDWHALQRLQVIQTQHNLCWRLAENLLGLSDDTCPRRRARIPTRWWDIGLGAGNIHLAMAPAAGSYRCTKTVNGRSEIASVCQ